MCRMRRRDSDSPRLEGKIVPGDLVAQTIPGIAELVAGNGGLQKLKIAAPAAAGEMYLHGAHVASWRPKGQDEVLFVSSQSNWGARYPIRGGVPICFPWFGAKAGDPQAPLHGVVRTTEWQLDEVTLVEDAVTVTMSLHCAAGAAPSWPHGFHLLHRVTFGAELTMELLMTNTAGVPQRFEEALHTYFRVGDAAQIGIVGLDSVRYIDKTDGSTEKTQSGEIKFTAETDRVYLATGDPVELLDPILKRRITVAKENSETTVVWNPWVAKAKALPDFGDEEWKEMACIETCNAGAFGVELAPGAQHSMKAVVGVKPL
jgi:glucose-6-phosphate 1-epimerase